MDLVSSAKPKPGTLTSSAMETFIRQFISALKTAAFVSVLVLLPFLIAYILPNIRYVFFDVVPRTWGLLCQFLTPSYLFLLLNLIIVTIAFITSLHHKVDNGGRRQDRDAERKVQLRDESASYAVDRSVIEAPVVSSVKGNAPLVDEDDAEEDLLEGRKYLSSNAEMSYGGERLLVSQGREAPSGERLTDENELLMHESHDEDSKDLGRSSAVGGAASGSESEDDAEIPSRSSRFLQEQARPISRQTFEKSPAVQDRPLSSTRFIHHRKAVKSSPEVRTLGISRPAKKGDTLEATWKAINEKRHAPLNRHLRKADTWETSPLQRSSSSLSKAEILDSPKTPSSPISDETLAIDPKLHHLKLRRREPSISQDELNRKVEEFISKFNEQMRLQRQESLLRYKEMVNRGSV